MRRRGHDESFWPSYVDISTTLFAIMVVLFAVSYSKFRIEKDKLVIRAKKYEEIEAIYDMVSKIDTNYFEFNPDYVKNIFKLQVTFQRGKFDIENDLLLDGERHDAADKLRERIIDAGEEIMHTIQALQQSESSRQDIKYLVVVEGQASSDGYDVNEWYNNDVLSYQRALHLVRFWKSHGIDFSGMQKCEIVVCGSGEGGVPRAQGDEVLNQRFLIQIVPVIGNMREEN